VQIFGASNNKSALVVERNGARISGLCAQPDHIVVARVRMNQCSAGQGPSHALAMEVRVDVKPPKL
jgi:hypothetical protein